MKPLKIKNYGSIPHLSNSKLGKSDRHISIGQEKILTIKKRDKHDLIIVTEKYDGSNVGVAKIDNKIYALTRNGYDAKTSKYQHHLDFATWVYNKKDFFDKMLKNGERLVGEWLGTPHGIMYEIKTETIVFFDFFNVNNERQLFSDLQSLNKKYNLPIVRILHIGDAIKTENLTPILNKKTAFVRSIEFPEGMVYRVERKGKVDFLAKWVRSDFIAGKYFK